MKRIDIHCHPSIKPYGRSFSNNPAGLNTGQVKMPNSIYHYYKPSAWDRFLNRMVMGLTEFTQTDFTSLHKGGFSIIVASLSPLEKQFITNYTGDNVISDGISNLVTGVGKERIEDIQSSVYRYFNDLRMDYDFYIQLNMRIVEIEGKKVQYKMVRTFKEIENAELNPDVHTLFVFTSVEGGHSFNNKNYKTYDRDDILNNVRTVKSWEFPPVFVTLAHHFKNHLTGHAQSLTGVVDWLTNQEADMNGELHEIGKEVIRLLLHHDKNNGPRCLIDIKHMSVKARHTYFDMLKNEYAGDSIPIIVSHGAVNGLISSSQKIVSHITNADTFDSDDINFYDDEIVRIGASNGLFGVQLDERRIANKERLRESNLILASRRKRLLAKSELVWNQIRYIAELLDYNDMAAWDIQCLGTDFDGIINPVNLFWTAEDIAYLEQNLLIHATTFIEKQGSLLKEKNRLQPTEIIEKFIYKNAELFLASMDEFRECNKELEKTQTDKLF
jgi:microsomal dipeptidase-like Zn-dependent dipeptidase